MRPAFWPRACLRWSSVDLASVASQLQSLAAATATSIETVRSFIIVRLLFFVLLRFEALPSSETTFIIRA
jgi:hypothetical protein